MLVKQDVSAISMDNVNLIGSYLCERARIYLKFRGKFIFKNPLTAQLMCYLIKFFISWELCFPIAKSASFITIPPKKCGFLALKSLALIRTHY